MPTRTKPPVLLPRALDDQDCWITPSARRTGRCPDCGGEVVPVVSAYYRPHFRHRACGGHHHGGGGSGVSPEHIQGQAGLIDLLAAYSPRREVHSSDANRQADVMITYRGQDVVFEVQHSRMSLSAMEARTRDWNGANAAVFWVFTSSMLEVTATGGVKLRSTAYQWAKHRGWQQCYVIDRRGILWWLDLRPPGGPVARPIVRGTRSRTGTRADLVVDRNALAGRDPLLVGAFAWTVPGRRRSPLGPEVPAWTPFGGRDAYCDTTPDAIVA